MCKSLSEINVPWEIFTGVKSVKASSSLAYTTAEDCNLISQVHTFIKSIMRNEEHGKQVWVSVQNGVSSMRLFFKVSPKRMVDCIIERLQYNACTEHQILCSVKCIKYLTNRITENKH